MCLVIGVRVLLVSRISSWEEELDMEQESKDKLDLHTSVTLSDYNFQRVMAPASLSPAKSHTSSSWLTETHSHRKREFGKT